MDWLRDLPWGVFWFGWGMVVLLAGGALYAAWWGARNAKAIGAQAPVDVRDLSAGYRLAWGKTIGPQIRAPLTGRACVWWKAAVWESVRERDADGKHRHVWRQIVDEESDRPLLIGDGDTVAAVWTWGATAVVPSGWSDWRGQSLPPEERAPDLHSGGAPGQGIQHDVQGTFGPRFRYVEQIIAADAPIFALGAVTRVEPALDDDDGGGEAEDTTPPAEDDDWRPEPSRLGLTPTPDAVIARDMASARWSIGTQTGKPFLLSTAHPDMLRAEQELGARGGQIMGAIFTALALFLAWVRLGG